MQFRDIWERVEYAVFIYISLDTYVQLLLSLSHNLNFKYIKIHGRDSQTRILYHTVST